MTSAWHQYRDDVLGSAWVLGAAAADLCMREAYHRVAAESAGFAGLAAAGLIVVVTSILAPRVGNRPGVVVLIRMLFVAAFVVAMTISIGTSLLVALAVGVLATVLGVAHFGDDVSWVRLRRALITAVVLFLVSQPILGWSRSQPIMWPRGFVPADALTDRHRNVTIILLFDELNANQSQGLARVLERSGLRVATKAVASVGANTQVVVPSIFAEQALISARPCSPWMTCGSTAAVDYSRIVATRPDIDIMGFFQPYCAIGGLRSCFRATIGLAFLDVDRIRCALLRRFGIQVGVDALTCRSVYFRTWSQLTEEVVAATSKARALREGGVLFAHVPLPHPPGTTVEGQLGDHYRLNLVRAAELLQQMLVTAKSAKLDPRVVVFSDHPLRQTMWCASFAPYVWDHCHPDPELEDTKIPIIAAGHSVPDLSQVESNLNVFRLAASWAESTR